MVKRQRRKPTGRRGRPQRQHWRGPQESRSYAAASLYAPVPQPTPRDRRLAAIARLLRAVADEISRLAGRGG